MATTKGKGIKMGEMVIFDNGNATVMGGEFEEPQDIVIYCDLCNEPLAITPTALDEVYLRCIKCFAINAKPTPKA